MAVLLLLKFDLGGALAVGQVEVGEQDVAAAVQQDVLGLQVPVHEAHEVQVLQRNQHLRITPAPPKNTPFKCAQDSCCWIRSSLGTANAMQCLHEHCVLIG